MFLECVASLIVHGTARNFALLLVVPGLLAAVACLVVSIFVARSEHKQEELLHTTDKKRLSLKTRRLIFVIVAVCVALGMAVAVGIPAVYDYEQERQPFNGWSAGSDVTGYGNNYQNGGMIDYQSGKLGYIMQDEEDAVLYVLDENGDREKYKGIHAPFAFCGEHILHTKNNGLYLRVGGQDDRMITPEADSFAVWNKAALYCVESNVYMYNTVSGNTMKLADDARQYVVYRDDLYVLSDDGTVAAINLFSNDRKTIGSITALTERDIMQVIEGTIVLYRQSCFELIDIKTWLSREIPIEADAQSCDAFVFICNDAEIVYSYRAANRQGSWQIDISSGERRMFSDEYYEQMYSYKRRNEFSNEWYSVYGVKDGKPRDLPYIDILAEKRMEEE